MKISKALKLKNKLVSEYTDTVNKLVSSNSYDVDSKKNYNSKELFTKCVNLRSEIVKLKTDIHIASNPIRSSIFLIGELKSFLSRINGMSTVEGVVKNSGYGASIAYTYAVDFSEFEKVAILKKLQDEIESIQEGLDNFNATTDI